MVRVSRLASLATLVVAGERFRFRQPRPVVTKFSAAFAQSSSSYVDSGITWQGLVEPIHGVTYGFVLPPAGSTGSLAQEFVGEIIAPVANEWVCSVVSDTCTF